MEIIELETEKYNRLLLAVKLTRLILPKMKKFELFSFSESFFRILTGFDKLCTLTFNNKQGMEEMLFFILQLRLRGGPDLILEKSGEKYRLINNDSQEPSSSVGADPCVSPVLEIPVKQAFFEIFENDPYYKNKINHLAIITCNRPEILEITLKKYISNIGIFKHKNIIITVFDDSDDTNSELNKKSINEIKKHYKDLIYFSKKDKLRLIDGLKAESKKRFPSLDSSKLQHYISYTFGDSNLPSTYGRNRNFVSFYYKNTDFIMLDDDSSPEVLTLNDNVILEVIEELCQKNKTDLTLLDKYISENESEQTQIVEVDFLGYFNTLNTKIPHYVKYSGDKDINSQFYLIKQMGFNFEEVGVFNFFSNIDDSAEGLRITDLLKTEAFIYGNKQSTKPSIKGLCCYFPSGSYDLRVTVPENIRIEDLVLGANYLLSTNNFPVETSFALYHRKMKRDITPEYIYSEIIGGIIFSVYFELIKKLKATQVTDMVFEFHKRIQTPVKLSKEAFDVIEQNKKEVLQLINNCAELTTNTDTIDKLKKISAELETEFYSLERKDYDNKTEEYINNILKEFAGCMLLWVTIREIILNDEL